MRSWVTCSAAMFLALMLSATPAAAVESRSAFDANDDGQVTFEEVMQRLEKSARSAFDSMDRNRDGVLSDKDFDDVREGMERLERWFEELLKPFLPEENTDHLET